MSYLSRYNRRLDSIADQNALMSTYESFGLINGTPGSLDLADARAAFERITQSDATNEEKDCLLDALGCAVCNNIVGGVATSLYMEILETKLNYV